MSAAASVAGLPRLDKYELLEEIGHGGMATVYRARDPRLGREVAVKLIHRHLRENAEVGTRFVAEARAAAKLRHPAIVDVFDVSNEDDPERYLVVELVRGCTLRKVLQKHRDMPAEIGAAITLRLCEAVEHAHASAIIHRDIKPENVLVELPEDRALAEQAALSAPRSSSPRPSRPSSEPIPPPRESEPSDTQASQRDAVTPRGLTAPKKHAEPVSSPPKHKRADPGVVIKITDFGIAKILDAQGVTSTGQVLGSPAHMAPEQIEGGDVDARTDVFALGVLMYECLVGHLPFEGKNPAQVLRRVLEGSYAPADRERAEVGGRWARIIAGALARDPAERIASAAQLGERITAELAALGITDPSAEIAAYFVDPAAYRATHVAALVPRLVARGEAARKAGDIPGAAADYNRALALAPHDLTILKRIGSLTSSAGRRVLARRVAAVVAGSAVLGLAAFGVARALKARDAGHKIAPIESAIAAASAPPVTSVTATASVEPRMRLPPLTSASAPIDAPVKRTPATPAIMVPAPPAASGTRNVKFTIRPKGARLIVDGSEQSWFGRSISLSIGGHTVEVAPVDPRCCRRKSTSINVEAPAPGKPGDQEVYLELDIVPASLTLSPSSPSGAKVSCAELGITLTPSATAAVKMRDLEATATCVFTAPDRPMRSTSVTVKAGEARTLAYPE